MSQVSTRIRLRTVLNIIPRRGLLSDLVGEALVVEKYRNFKMSAVPHGWQLTCSILMPNTTDAAFEVWTLASSIDCL